MTDTGHQPHLPNARQRQNLAVTLLSLVITVAAVVGIVLVTSRRAEGEIRPPAEFAERITEYDNGDFTYTFPEEDIRLDEEEGELYVDDTLVVRCAGDLSPTEKNELAKLVGGTIVGHLDSERSVLQIHVDSATRDELVGLCQTLLDTGDVTYASYEFPLFMCMDSVKDDTNAWAGTDDNWWAETIGAYEAWEYDHLFGDVEVGVIDTGFELDHPELTGVVELAPNSRGNLVDTHGTAVSSVIGANDNDVGLRGVASGSDNAGNVRIWGVSVGRSQNGRTGIYYSTAELMNAMRDLLRDSFANQHRVRVINCSWGISPVENFAKYLTGSEPDPHGTCDQLQQNSARQSTERAILLLIDLLTDGAGDEDPDANRFIIVQSAGNQLDGGNPLESWRNGFFCGIDQNSFSDYVSTYGDPGVPFEELEQRTLVAGAAAGTGASSGQAASESSAESNQGADQSGQSVPLADFSCFGEEWVDICAPGENIYAADIGGTFSDFSGTSFSAPIVSGAAALLWSVDPSLTPTEVRSLLLDYGDGTCTAASSNQSGSYPLLDIGASIEVLVAQLEPGYQCSVQVFDKQSGAVISGAKVLFSPLEEKNIYSVTTDEQGFAKVGVSIPSERVDVVVTAEGYKSRELTLRATPSPAEGHEADDTVQRIALAPGEDGQGAKAASEMLATLVDELGALRTGTEEFDRPDQIKSGWTLVPEERLDGLLLADLFDYDSDDQPELLTVSVRPRDGWEAPGRNMAGWSEAEITISVYEVAASAPNLADEMTLVVPGLPDEHPETSVHVFRGSRQGCLVYLDVYGAFNDQWMATLGVRYTSGGSLVIEGGGLLYEHYNDVLCLAAMAGEGAPALFNAAPYNEPWDGWTELCHLSWGDEPTPEGGFFDDYAEAYEVALGSVGLAPGVARSGFAGSTDELARTREKCAMRPSATLSLTTDGKIVELGGIVSRTQEDTRGIELTVYDETGLLDSWR